MITELEIEETVKRVVKCEPGYRFLSDEELKQGTYVGEWWNDLDKQWQREEEYCVINDRPHFMRIKLSPEIFTHNGKRYEEEFDPNYLFQPTDLFRCNESGNVWKLWNHSPSLKVKLSDYPASRKARVARPLDSMYEGEVTQFGNGCAIWLDNSKGLTPGQRVRVEVIG